MYVSWAAFYEGTTDQSYLNTLIPRLLEEILRVEGKRPTIVPEAPLLLGQFGRSRQEVAREICANKDAFHLLFVHADTGGRAVAAGIADRREAYIEQANLLCQFEPRRAIFVSPRSEIEAWALCDVDALKTALGVKKFPATVAIPTTAQAAEALVDPKATFSQIINSTSRRRRKVKAGSVLPSIALEQNFEELRNSTSFVEFEESLRHSLRGFDLLD